ncbi:MAG: hypothetical protein AAF206_29565, partial [Bacteroidota bacterium]
SSSGNNSGGGTSTVPGLEGEDPNFTPSISYHPAAPATGAALKDRYNGNFTIKFNDKDRSGRGLVNRFYLLAQGDADGYHSNPSKGYFYEDFNAGLSKKVWTTAQGNWRIQGKQLKQTDGNNSNTNVYAALKQNNKDVYLYQWNARFDGNGNSQRLGMHFFCSDPSKSNRGNSYFVWIRNASSGDYVEIYKTVNNSFERKSRKAITIESGKVYNFKTIYNPTKGRIEVYINNRYTLAWIDRFPLQTGKGIALRTGNTMASFDDVQVFLRRSGSAVKVKVGRSGNDDLASNGPFLVHSLVIDKNIRWSKIGRSVSVAGKGSAPVVSNNDSEPDPDPPISSTPVQNDDFRFSFSSGSGQHFYLVSDFQKNRWTANEELGFFIDQFSNRKANTGWRFGQGSWRVSEGLIEQADAASGNTNAYIPLKQDNDEVYLYHWRSKLTSPGENKRFGLHFFASKGNSSNRGNSYFVWFRNNEAKQDKVEIYRVDNDAFALKESQFVSMNPNVWYDCKLLYIPATGRMEVYLNNQRVLNWRDPAGPIRDGKFISLRTGNSQVQFSDLRVYKQSASKEVLVTIGGNNDMIRTKSVGDAPAGRILHLSLAGDKWSEVKEELFRVE